MQDKGQINFSIYQRIEAIFEQKRGHSFQFPQRNEAVILLLSGGADSIALWGFLMAKYQLHVYPLHISVQAENGVVVDTGQQKAIVHYSQLYAAKYPNYFHAVEYVKHSFTFTFDPRKVHIDSADFIANHLHYSQYYQKYSLILIGNPSRLLTYTTYGYEYALKLGYNRKVDVKTLLVAIVADDTHILHESTLAMLRSINLSLCLALNDFSYKLEAPIDKNHKFYLSKKDLMQFAQEQQIDLADTWSCDKSNRYHCGGCPSCYTRKQSFAEAGIQDKTTYRGRSTLIKREQYRWLFQYIKRVVFFLKKLWPQRHFTLEPSVFFVAGENITWHKEGALVHLFDAKYRSYEQLNETASLIWLVLIEDKKSVAEVTRQLEAVYAISAAQCQADVEQFIIAYLRAGFLKPEKGQRYTA